MRPVILLEMNEIAVPFVERYAAKGLLPGFRAMFEKYGYVQTQSETVYEHLEPWIQWVSLHSGLEYSQHQIFRLGDAAKSDVRQIYEILEQKGLRVGAVSPMNATNRLKRAAFFVPDPWTGGAVSGPPDLKRLYDAIAQAVNDNAQQRITLMSMLGLLYGFVSYSRVSNLASYIGYLLGAGRAPWKRALFLDCLLSDVFIKLWRNTKPDFASLFLNGAAHIQHHYFFCSSAYSGTQRNPEWYVRPGVDPLLEVYQLYDSIVEAIQRMAPDARIVVATGLSQEPYERAVYYYRLKDHGAFLRALNVPFRQVLPRMSRDFLVECGNQEDAKTGEKTLSEGTSLDGVPIFEVDNRGASLFVTLSYPHLIEKGMQVRFGKTELTGFEEHVAFVAIKNGHHIGTGYLIDTGLPKSQPDEAVFLTSVFNRILAAFPG